VIIFEVLDIVGYTLVFFAAVFNVSYYLIYQKNYNIILLTAFYALTISIAASRIWYQADILWAIQ